MTNRNSDRFQCDMFQMVTKCNRHQAFAVVQLASGATHYHDIVFDLTGRPIVATDYDESCIAASRQLCADYYNQWVRTGINEYYKISRYWWRYMLEVQDGELHIGYLPGWTAFVALSINRRGTILNVI